MLRVSPKPSEGFTAHRETASEDLVDFAAQQQRRFDALTSPDQRKQRGHFGTPPGIAQFMAAMFSEIPEGTVWILDPGAGVGTLAAALCQRILQGNSSQALHVELWENDPSLIPILEETMRCSQQALRDAGHPMEFVIRQEDFILANTRRTLFDGGREPAFQWAILNPPYFKLRKESPQAQAMGHVVHGQPNVYALFAAVAADLLLPGGEMVAITPRSYFNGPYFKRFRKWFFDRMTARQIHLFGSRTEAFREDAVLQENVILHAIKGAKPGDVVLTSSEGRNLDDVERASAAYTTIIDNGNGDHVVRVAASRLEQEIVDAMDRLPNRFRDLGFEISTGPVVTFRATQFLRHERADDTAPLLWMHNVRPFITRFPTKNGKPTHIEVSDASRKLLVQAKTYVLLKRFTAKEENRRLVAGIVTPADSYSEWLGLENHLNYVYRKVGELTEEEVYGLAAFFNSAIVDKYFRAISGNTQVNAAEIRGMPMPDAKAISAIGRRIRKSPKIDCALVEKAVGQAMDLSQRLIDELIEVPS